MNVSRMAIWKIEKLYRKYGDDGLKLHKPGRLFEPLNPQFYQLVIEEWKKNKCGARKLHAILKRKGFGVSRRKIEQVMVTEGFQKPVEKRRKPRKYKRYEWPIPNYMWHTDWHVIKAVRLKGENILVYIDDCSRKIMGYCLGAQTTKNSLFALYSAIAEHGVTPFCLNSDRGAQFIANKFDKNGKALSIEEKPKNPKSKFAVPGLYIYNNEVVNISKNLKPSPRGELEITDVNNHYIEKNQMSYHVLESEWTDAGTFDSLLRANLIAAGIKSFPQ